MTLAWGSALEEGHEKTGRKSEKNYITNCDVMIDKI